jgi:hypothetical protein
VELEEPPQRPAEVGGRVVDLPVDGDVAAPRGDAPFHGHALAPAGALGADHDATAAAGLDGDGAVHDLDEGAGRLHLGAGRGPGARAGSDVHGEGVPVQRRGAGGREVGVVSLLLLVPRRLGLGVEPPVVDDDVASDQPHAAEPDLAGQCPEALRRPGRVAPAAHVEGGDGPIGGLARRPDLGLEAVAEAEPVERSRGGEELHVGGGVEERVGVVRVDDPAVVEREDRHADARPGQSALAEQPVEGLRDGAGRRGSGEGEQEEQGEHERILRHDRGRTPTYIRRNASSPR